MNARERTSHADMRARAASALRGSEQPLPSPCIGRCQIDRASGVCCGCWRTLNEIMMWQRLSDKEKRQVWRAIVKRSAQTQ